MKANLVLLLLPLLSTVHGQGFFSSITNSFNRFLGGGTQRPAQRPNQFRRPPQARPQQQFQQQQAQFQPPQQAQFQPQQAQFQPQQAQFQPQQAQFQPQQAQFQHQAAQFQPQAPQAQFQPQAPQAQFQPTTQVRPPQQQQPAFNQQPFRQQPARQPQTGPPAQVIAAQPPAVRGTAKCSDHEPNHFWTDPRDGRLRGYVVTWKFASAEPDCSKMAQNEAREYCQSLGMEPVSLDSPQKQDEFNRLIAQDAQRFFWTGGIVDHSQEIVFWSNRNGAPVPFSQSAHWSHTGGAGLAQPDNRAKAEEGIDESCLGILNNFYADGIKWHDVACHHKKPTVCEPIN